MRLKSVWNSVIPVGNAGLKSKEKAISEKLGEFRKQEKFEDKKTLSKRKTSLGQLSGDVCQERKTSAERLLLLR